MAGPLLTEVELWQTANGCIKAELGDRVMDFNHFLLAARQVSLMLFYHEAAVAAATIMQWLRTFLTAN